MSNDPKSPYYGWGHHPNRTHAHVPVTTSSGDQGTTATSDPKGTAWAPVFSAHGFTGVSAALTPSDSVALATNCGRGIIIVCSVAGNLKIGFVDGSVLTFPVAVGLTVMPFITAQVFVTGTTATCSVYQSQ